jgi:hypothetical protein
MEFKNEHYPEHNFYLHLISNVEKFDCLNSLEHNDNVLILNPDYVKLFF